MKSQLLRKSQSEDVLAASLRKFNPHTKKLRLTKCPRTHSALDPSAKDLAVRSGDIVQFCSKVAKDTLARSSECALRSDTRRTSQYADPSRALKEAILYVDSTKKAAHPGTKVAFSDVNARALKESILLDSPKKSARAGSKGAFADAKDADVDVDTQAKSISARPPWTNPRGVTRASLENKLRKPKTAAVSSDSCPENDTKVPPEHSGDQDRGILEMELRRQLDMLTGKNQVLEEELDKERRKHEEASKKYMSESHIAQERMRVAETTAEQSMGTSQKRADEIATVREEMEKLKKSSKKTEDNLRADLQAQQDAHNHENMMHKILSEKNIKEAKKQQSDTKRRMTSKEEVAQEKIVELTTSLQSTAQKLNVTRQAHQREDRARRRLEQSLDQARQESLTSVAESQRLTGQLEMAELKLRVSEKMCRKYEEDAAENTPKVEQEQRKWEELKCEIADYKQELAEEKERSKIYAIDAQEAADILQKLLQTLKEVEFQRDQYARNLNTAEETMRRNLLTQQDVEAHFRDSSMYA